MTIDGLYSEHVIELADEFIEKCRQGERPSLADYESRYPELATTIRELFPAMAMLEGIMLDAELDATSRALDSASPAFPLNKMFGDFRLIRLIGRGGMGDVYEAEQVSLRRRVAIKLLAERFNRDARTRKRFERESAAAAGLHHANIVPVFGFGEVEGQPFIVMQYIAGQTLTNVIHALNLNRDSSSRNRVVGVSTEKGSPQSIETDAELPPLRQPSAYSGQAGENVPRLKEAACRETARSGMTRESRSGAEPPFSPDEVESVDLCSGQPMSWKTAARLGAQLAGAVAHSHRCGLLHRDIKPGNVLLDTNHHVWITDFGLAKATDDADLTESGDILGTLRYLAPEALRGEFDVRSDIFGLGLTLYELVTLDRAYASSDRHDLIREVTAANPPRPRSRRPEIPRDLEAIILKAIDRQPDDRYQTADELAEDLQRFAQGLPLHAHRFSVPHRAIKWARRNPWSTVALLSGIILLVAFSWFSLASYQAQQRRVVAHNQELRDIVSEAARLLDLSLEDPENSALRLDAYAALGRASTMSEEEATHPEFHDEIERIDRRLSDLKAAMDLNRQLQMVQIETDRIDYASNSLRPDLAIREYYAVLGEFDLRVPKTPSGEAIDWIRVQPACVRATLIDGFDRIIAFETSREIAAWAFDVAQACDDDLRRRQLRERLASGHIEAVLEFLEREPPGSLSATILGMAGMHLKRHGERDRVIRLLSEGQAAHPDDFALAYRLALMLSAGNESEQPEALRFASIAVALRPSNPGVNLTFAGLLFANGRLDEARNVLERVVEQQAYYQDALLLLCCVSRALGDDARAEQCIADLLEHPTADVLDSVATDLHQRWRFGEALEFRQRAVAAAPDDPQKLGNLALTFVELNRLDEALLTADAALALDDTLPENWTHRGRALFGIAMRAGLEAEGHAALLEASEDAFRRGAEAGRFKRYCRVEQAMFYANTQRYPLAISALRDWQADRPEDSRVHVDLAVVAVQQGHLEEAWEHLQRARGLEVEDSRIEYSEGKIALQKGEFSLAIQKLEGVYNREPSVPVLQNLGEAYFQNRQYEQAIKWFQKRLEDDSTHSLSLSRIGIAASRLGNFELAAQCYGMLVTLEPDRSAHHYNFGNALRGMMRVEEAIDAYGKAIELRLDFAEAYCNLGQSLEFVGRFEEALQALTTGHELGMERDSWPYPTASLIETLRLKIELQGRIDDLRAGRLAPANDMERVQYAIVCQAVGEYELSIALFKTYWEQPANRDVYGNHLYVAACAISQWMATRLTDDGGFADEETVSENATLALEYLRAGLDHYSSQQLNLDLEPPLGQAVRLRGWQLDRRLEALRDPDSLLHLPPELRQAFKDFWRDVESITGLPPTTSAPVQ